MTIIVVTHELASALLIADRMLLIDKGNIVALGPCKEMRASTAESPDSFSIASPEPRSHGEMDYLQMLTAERHEPQSSAGKRGKVNAAKRRGRCSSDCSCWRCDVLSLLYSTMSRRRRKIDENSTPIFPSGGPNLARPCAREDPKWAASTACSWTSGPRSSRRRLQRSIRHSCQSRQQRQDHEHEPARRTRSPGQPPAPRAARDALLLAQIHRLQRLTAQLNDLNPQAQELSSQSERPGHRSRDDRTCK